MSLMEMREHINSKDTALQNDELLLKRIAEQDEELKIYIGEIWDDIAAFCTKFVGMPASERDRESHDLCARQISASKVMLNRWVETSEVDAVGKKKLRQTIARIGTEAEHPGQPPMKKRKSMTPADPSIPEIRF